MASHEKISPEREKRDTQMLILVASQGLLRARNPHRRDVLERQIKRFEKRLKTIK